MPAPHTSDSFFHRFLTALFSFETAFALYLFAGFYKSSEYLNWIPGDLTLFFLVLSVMAGGWALWKRGFAVSRRSAALMAAMAIFSGWVLASLLWAPPTRYGVEKATQFALLNGWALAGAAAIMDGDRKRLTRFYGAILALAFLFSLETLRVYLPHMDVRSYLVLGATYQAIGRSVGLGFVVTSAAYFGVRAQTRRRWLFLGLALLYFFVLLIVGARGPFLAAILALALILSLVRGQLTRKAGLLVALALLYLAGSLTMGPSLRTLYRFNVLLTHEVGWNLPGANPTPAALSTSTTKPQIPTPNEVSNQSVELRQERYGNAWRLWRTAPLIGAGVGSFAFHFPAEQFRVYPHNMILEILSELGVVGLILWMVLFVIAFGGCVRRGAWRRTFSVLALGFLIFTLVNAMISGDIASNRHLFTALGLLVATSDLQGEER